MILLLNASDNICSIWTVVILEGVFSKSWHECMIVFWVNWDTFYFEVFMLYSCVFVFLRWCHRGRIRRNASPELMASLRVPSALADRSSSSQERRDRGSGGRDRATPSRTPSEETMEAVAEELRAGSRIPVTVEQIVNDTLVVTLTYRERSYTGVLLDCGRKWVAFLCVFFCAKPRLRSGQAQQQARRTQAGLNQRQWEEQQPASTSQHKRE